MVRRLLVTALMHGRPAVIVVVSLIVTSSVISRVAPRLLARIAAVVMPAGLVLARGWALMALPLRVVVTSVMIAAAPVNGVRGPLGLENMVLVKTTVGQLNLDKPVVKGTRLVHGLNGAFCVLALGKQKVTEAAGVARLLVTNDTHLLDFAELGKLVLDRLLGSRARNTRHVNIAVLSTGRQLTLLLGLALLIQGRTIAPGSNLDRLLLGSLLLCWLLLR